MAGPSTVVVTIGGLVTCADAPRLCDRVRRLLDESDAEVVDCDVGSLVEPDLATVDVLARLALTAQRAGRSLRLRRASAELEDLLAFVGLGTESDLTVLAGSDPCSERDSQIPMSSGPPRRRNLEHAPEEDFR